MGRLFLCRFNGRTATDLEPEWRAMRRAEQCGGKGFGEGTADSGHGRVGNRSLISSGMILCSGMIHIQREHCSGKIDAE